ncbi:MAG: BlaI/MecI/CopY family transcriptional regulator [Chloroflexi bacterium]|nr:BlaI/MecI/CopY family transcriptional regulator [Chloroflexota bacterium]MCI0576950.1 BlaI/MecI/CopY family transcriptional regulator [Chloroflexota bacterium]MCI0648434.1 BlaI/MecI/CopY family transcriptional regulator [Chloroflexota bacterium]MCI0725776.1 BlaI/MecI/CopY family transcriptional regulator [Chloroflexota bacterium]
MPARRYSRLTGRSGKGVEKILGELELAVMGVAWEHESVTVRDVLNVLSGIRPLAYTTVMTIMGRLAEKGLLVADKQGKTYRYRAALTREALEAQAVGRVVESLLADFGGEIAVNQFVEKLSTVNPEQLERLAELARLAQEGQDET